MESMRNHDPKQMESMRTHDDPREQQWYDKHDDDPREKQWYDNQALQEEEEHSSDEFVEEEAPAAWKPPEPSRPPPTRPQEPSRPPPTRPQEPDWPPATRPQEPDWPPATMPQEPERPPARAYQGKRSREEQPSDEEAAETPGSSSRQEVALSAVNALSNIAMANSSASAHGWIWRDLLPAGTRGRREPWRTRGGANRKGGKSKGKGKGKAEDPEAAGSSPAAVPSRQFIPSQPQAVPYGHQARPLFPPAMPMPAAHANQGPPLGDSAAASSINIGIRISGLHRHGPLFKPYLRLNLLFPFAVKYFALMRSTISSQMLKTRS